MSPDPATKRPKNPAIQQTKSHTLPRRIPDARHKRLIESYAFESHLPAASAGEGWRKRSSPRVGLASMGCDEESAWVSF